MIRLVLATVAVAAFIAHSLLPSHHHVNCDSLCISSASSAAVWYALNELDCDESDYGMSAPCNDELGNVNKAPVVVQIVERKNRTVVTLTTQNKNGGTFGTEALTVDNATDEVVGVKQLPA